MSEKENPIKRQILERLQESPPAFSEEEEEERLVKARELFEFLGNPDLLHRLLENDARTIAEYELLTRKREDRQRMFPEEEVIIVVNQELSTFQLVGRIGLFVGRGELDSLSKESAHRYFASGWPDYRIYSDDVEDLGAFCYGTCGSRELTPKSLAESHGSAIDKIYHKLLKYTLA